jgi:peptide/nickel transport system substrate-binding protein
MVAAPAFLISASAATSPSAVPATTSVDPAPESAKATFTVGIVEDVDSLNPFTGINAEAYEAWGMMYDTLIGYSQKDFSPVPGLATAWKESPDHSTWTYTIRSGVKWSDGVPLTSADVAYTFNRILKGTYEQTNYGNYVAGIKTVTAPDATTVVMKVKTPSPIMTRLAVPILPEHIWKNISESKVKSFSNEPSSGKPVVGSGPFVLTTHSKNQFLRFKANPDYFLGAPKVGEVDLRWFGSQEPMTQALRSGEIDMIDALDAGPFQSLQGVKGITSVAAKYSGFDEFAFNTGAALADGTPIGNGNPALKDKAFRIAVSHAVDKETLLTRSLQGRGELGSSIIPTIYPNLHYDPGASAIAYDVAEANKELDAAGYPKGSNGTRNGKDGKPIKLRLFARSESQTSKQAINFLQGWLKDIGIGSTVKVMSNDTLTEVIGQGNYDIFHWGWVVEPDPDYQLSTFTCDKRSYKDAGQIYADLSDSFYCNKAYDALYAQQAKTTDPDARAEIVKRMEKMVYDDAPYIVTDYYDDLEAYRSDKWGNVQAQPADGGVLVFQYGTYTYRNVELQTDIKAAAAAASSSAAASGSTPAASGAVSASNASSDSSSGSSTWIWILVAVAAVAVVGGAFLMGRRRGASAEDDEE